MVRVARITHVSTNPSRRLIAGKIYQGPQSELGMAVHMMITHDDVPAIRNLLNAIEKEHER
jgi:hypothetical protein